MLDINPYKSMNYQQEQFFIAFESIQFILRANALNKCKSITILNYNTKKWPKM